MHPGELRAFPQLRPGEDLAIDVLLGDSVALLNGEGATGSLLRGREVPSSSWPFVLTLT